MRLEGLACLSLALWGCARPAEVPPKGPSTQGSGAETPCVPEEEVPWDSFTIERDDPCRVHTDLKVQIKQTSTCIPRVTPEELTSPTFWSKPVLLEAVEWTTWDRKLTCKSMTCSLPGLALVAGGAPAIPVQIPARGAPGTSGDIHCEHVAPGRGCAETMFHLEPGRAWIGIVRPHFTADSPVPTLTFDLFGVEQPAD